MKATIIGTGPSLLRVKRTDIPTTGPVLALNSAIVHVRRLGLDNEIYSCQKDMCITAPEAPETLVLSRGQSPDCFPLYPKRMVIDVVEELQIPFHSVSATMAVALASRWGCDGAIMLAQDGYFGDRRRVIGEQIQNTPIDYGHHAREADEYAASIGFPLEWRTHYDKRPPGMGHRLRRY